MDATQTLLQDIVNAKRDLRDALDNLTDCTQDGTPLDCEQQAYARVQAARERLNALMRAWDRMQWNGG